MEILERIRVFRRWLWLIILVGLVFAAAGYFIRARQPPVYQTSARLLIGSFIRVANPDSQQFNTSIELVRTYAVLAHTNEILEETVSTYNLPMSAGELRARTRTITSADVPILEISASYNNPEIAARMANGLVEQLVFSSPTNLTLEQQNQRAFLQAEIASLTQQLNSTREQIRDVERRERDAYTLETIERLRAERLTLNGNIIQVSSTIASLSQTLATLQERTNSLDIIEYAQPPGASTGASTTIIAGLGFIVGAMLAGGAVLLLDELDQTMKSSGRVKRYTGLPVLSMVRAFNAPREASPRWLVAVDSPLSPAADAYRLLQGRLLYVDREPSYEYIFTSARQGEGKSITAANLAVTLASAGFRVAMIDVNLRDPVQHLIFGVENDGGLVKLLALNPDEPGQTDTSLRPHLDALLKRTKYENLFVIPRGTLADDASISHMMFRLNHLARWIDLLRGQYGIDAFVFDTAPSLSSSESLVLAGALPSEIIMVVEAGRTRREDAQEAIEQFSNTGSQVKGVVLNKV